MASNHTGPVVYLPQSIGPLKGIVGWYTRKLLKKVGMIFVRDTRSYELLKKDGCNVFQVPDLAVQEVFNKQKVANQLIKSRKVYLIARDVDSINRKAYIRRLKVLIEQIPGIEPIVQSSGRGNNDSDFYMSLGLNGPYRSVREALEYESGVVVSVRLHGAIESIIAGCPTIHLSYERKGFSAYEDLNIKDYVHNYRSFIPDRVAFQIDELINDSSNYWAALEKSSAEVRDKRSFMLKTINNYLEGEF
jgi:polysaccharide pyruvyl transferase WcaK-like protein